MLRPLAVICGLLVIATCERLECPSGWQYLQSKGTCLKDMQESKDWEGARSSCKDLGADLVQISDRRMNREIAAKRNHTQENYWIGVRDTDHDSKYEYVNGTEMITSGKGLAFWGGSNYTYDETNGACVIYNHTYNKHNNVKCTLKFPFLCEQSRDLFENGCPEEWEFFRRENICILLISQYAKTWQAAREYCEHVTKGSLVTARNRRKEWVLKDMMAQIGDKTSYWIGAHDPRRDGIFEYVNGEKLCCKRGKVSFLPLPCCIQIKSRHNNIFPENNGHGLGPFGIPSTLGHTEDCVILIGNFEEWATEDCEDSINFFCERPANDVTPDNASPTVQIQGTLPPTRDAKISFDKVKMCGKYWLEKFADADED